MVVAGSTYQPEAKKSTLSIDITTFSFFLLGWCYSTIKVHLHWSKANAKLNCFLWYVSLRNVNITFDSLWTYLEAMSLSPLYKRTLYLSLGTKFLRMSARTHLCSRHICPSVRYSCRVCTWRWTRSWAGPGGIPGRSSHRTVQHTRPDSRTAPRGSPPPLRDSPVEPYPTQHRPRIHILQIQLN